MGVSGPPDGPLTPRLGPAFFARDAVTCARELVGCTLVWGECAGLVVETEAYAAVGDEAAHPHFRPGARRFIAENAAGTAYVYFSYGVHWMLNVLVKAEPDAPASPRNGIVLIRALEPLAGLGQMRERRGREGVRELCSGPGKLAQALAITGGDHCRDLLSGPAGFHARSGRVRVEADVRIGISRSVELPWRFLLAGSPFVSAKKRPAR